MARDNRDIKPSATVCEICGKQKGAKPVCVSLRGLRETKRNQTLFGSLRDPRETKRNRTGCRKHPF